MGAGGGEYKKYVLTDFSSIEKHDKTATGL